MRTRKRNTGFGLNEFLVVTVLVAVAVGLVLAIYSRHATSSDAPDGAVRAAHACLPAGDVLPIDAAFPAFPSPPPMVA